jgi:hypothetical protein
VISGCVQLLSHPLLHNTPSTRFSFGSMQPASHSRHSVCNQQSGNPHVALYVTCAQSVSRCNILFDNMTIHMSRRGCYNHCSHQAVAVQATSQYIQAVRSHKPSACYSLHRPTASQGCEQTPRPGLSHSGCQLCHADCQSKSGSDSGLLPCTAC